MYQVISKNHATRENKIVARYIKTEEKAKRMALRFTQAETNKDIVYEVEPQN